jgi:tetratricopeptide repeat protein 8
LASRINTSSFASRPPLARALIDYLLYHDHNPRVALSVCAALSEKLQFSDSWVKARMGKCYLQLGLHREAEQQYTSALRGQRWPWVALELAQVYLALDQPLKALDTYYTGMTDPLAQGEVAFLLFAARTHVRLGEDAAAAEAYRNVLVRQPTSVEAMATLAAQLYGLGHPERAERLYRRAGLLGAGSAALVNNLAVCALGSGQSDVSLYWLQRALALARGDEAADVWFNVGHVGLMSGDETMAEQALKNCLAVKGDHAEALNNLGVLELRRADSKTGSSATSALLSAKSLFNNAVQADSLLGDAHLNLALTCLRLGKLEDAFASATLALNAGAEANELVRVLSERMRGAA